jgi:hypothetical protein
MTWFAQGDFPDDISHSWMDRAEHRDDVDRLPRSDGPTIEMERR